MSAIPTPFQDNLACYSSATTTSNPDIHHTNIHISLNTSHFSFNPQYGLLPLNQSHTWTYLAIRSGQNMHSCNRTRRRDRTSGTTRPLRTAHTQRTCLIIQRMQPGSQPTTPTKSRKHISRLPSPRRRLCCKPTPKRPLIGPASSALWHLPSTAHSEATATMPVPRPRMCLITLLATRHGHVTLRSPKRASLTLALTVAVLTIDPNTIPTYSPLTTRAQASTRECLAPQIPCSTGMTELYLQPMPVTTEDT